MITPLPTRPTLAKPTFVRGDLRGPDSESEPQRLDGCRAAPLRSNPGDRREPLARVVLFRQAARGELGQLNIGFNASAPFVPRIAKAIFDYRQAYPDVKLALTELAGRVQPTALTDHALDLCFVRVKLLPFTLPLPNLLGLAYKLAGTTMNP